MGASGTAYLLRKISTGIICIGVFLRPPSTNNEVFLAIATNKSGVFIPFRFTSPFHSSYDCVPRTPRSGMCLTPGPAQLETNMSISPLNFVFEFHNSASMQETARSSTVPFPEHTLPLNVQAHPAATDPVPNENPRRHFRPRAIFSDLHILVPA